VPATLRGRRHGSALISHSNLDSRSAKVLRGDASGRGFAWAEQNQGLSQRGLGAMAWFSGRD